MKKILLRLHEHYADFQIGHILLFLNKLGRTNITTVSIDGTEVTSLGGLKVVPDTSLENIRVNEYDLLLIPGGDGIHLSVFNEKLTNSMKSAYEANAFIASMCEIGRASCRERG